MPITCGYTPDVIRQYTKAGYWRSKNATDYIIENAAQRTDKIAYIQGEKSITWGEYSILVDKLALAFLDMGIKKEDRFAIYLPDWKEAHIAIDALSKIGAVSVAININQRAKELEYMLNLTEAVGIITPSKWRELDYIEIVKQLRPNTPELKYHLVVGDDERPDIENLNTLLNEWPEEKDPADYLEQFHPSPNETFLMNFTSGTTGLPKCVLHTPNRWIYFVRLAIDGGKLTSEDVMLALVPNNSGFGLWTSHVCPIMLGAKTILLERFDAEEALRVIEREKVSVVTAVTTQFIKMLQVPNFSKYDLTSWRVMYTGGQDVPYEKVKELESSTGCTVLQFYGSVESGAVSRTVLGESLEQRTKTVGKPVPEMNVKLFDPASGEEVTAPGQVGEVACKGPSIGSGYYNDPENTKKLFNSKGWLLTGDLGTIGEDGYLRLVGRVKDIIIRGGQNISAAEVEDAICGHPKVAEVAVVAMPDPVFGEKACAYVVTKAGQDITYEELVTYLNNLKTAKYKLPERLEMVTELPLSPGGKVMKNVLRNAIANKIKNEQGLQ